MIRCSQLSGLQGNNPRRTFHHNQLQKQITGACGRLKMRVKLFKSGDLVRHIVWRDQLGLVIDVNPATTHLGRQIAVQWLETYGIYGEKRAVVFEDLVEKVT